MQIQQVGHLIMTLIWSTKIIKAQITSDRIKLNAWMKKNYPALTLSHLQKLCRTGQIRLNGKRVVYNTPMVENDELRLPPFIEEYKTVPDIKIKKNTKYSQKDIDDILKTIIYEDKEIIVLNKPAGIATQGGTGITKHIDTLINTALPEYNNNLRLTHRIDKETSGILVIAKNYEASLKITTMFKEKRIKKTYLAFVYGNFDDKKKEGRIKAPILFEDDKDNKPKSAITDYKVLDEAFGMLSLVSLSPLTGRTHQLRIHMKNAGHPIIGDFKYGNTNDFSKLKDSFEIDIARNLYLHAYQIEIEGKPIIKANMPVYFERICKYLNF